MTIIYVIAVVVRAHDRQLAQEMGINTVAGRWFLSVRPAVDRRELHQRCDVQATDADPAACEKFAQHPAAGERLAR